MARLVSAVSERLGVAHTVPVIYEFTGDVPFRQPLAELAALLQTGGLPTLLQGIFPTFLEIPSFRMVASYLTPELVDPALATTGLRRVYLNRTMYAMPHLTHLSRKVPLSYTRRLLGVDRAEQLGYDGSGVRIAVIDTGVENIHPALSMKVEEHGTVEDFPVGDSNGHGTHVTATVGGNPVAEIATGFGGPGMASAADLASYKALGSPLGIGSEASVIRAMELAVQDGADVVSMSLGARATERYEDDAQAQVLDRLAGLERGPLFLVAAGNSGPDGYTVGTPGWAKKAITVGAADPETGETAGFSSRGPTNDERVKPDCVGPGVDIFAPTTGLMDANTPETVRWASLSGTSMATPHIAGLFALAKQLAASAGVRFGWEQAMDLLRTFGGSKGNDRGHGAVTWQWIEDWFQGDRPLRGRARVAPVAPAASAAFLRPGAVLPGAEEPGPAPF